MNLKQTFAKTSILLAFSAPSFAAIDFYISDIKGEYRSFAINDSSALAVIRANISDPDCPLTSNGKKLKGWKNIVVSGDSEVLEALGPTCGEGGISVDMDDVNTSALWKQPHDEVFSVEGITSPNYDVSSLQLVRKNVKVAIGTSSVKKNKSVYRTSSQTQVRAVLAHKNTGQLSFAMAKKMNLSPTSTSKGNNWAWDTRGTHVSDDGLFIVGYQRAKHDINFKSHNANDPSFVDDENYIAKGTRIPTYWKLKPGSKPSCNSACKNGEEVHLEVLGSAKRIANGKTNPSIKAPISLNVEGAYQNVDIEALSKTEFADSYNAEMNDAQTKTEYMSKVNGIYSYGDQYYVFGMNSDGYAAFAVID